MNKLSYYYTVFLFFMIVILTGACFAMSIYDETPASAESKIDSREVYPMATPFAVMYTDNVQGDAYSEGSIFSFDVKLRENVSGPVESFAFRVYLNTDNLQFSPPVLAIDLKAPIQVSPLKGLPPNQYIDILSMVDNINTLFNPSLCRLRFKTIKKITSPYIMKIGSSPPSPAIVLRPTIGLYPTFDYTSTNPVPGFIETPTPTPKPTHSPTATTTPTPTPTPAPSSTALPTPTSTPAPTQTPMPSPTSTQAPTPTPTPAPSSTASPTPTSTPAPTLTPTPVSFEMVVNHITGRETLTPEQIKIADLNSDGVIDAADIVMFILNGAKL
ncbi:MAG TPA: dockerin type I repeat-containing protein [Candidatus Sumerlaeota bacterium]|nr:dockerin type I repeat-containing protein [Candidatus Sumerlaeota bacterium]HON49519.1 dockerin type I repeat-containing protein [Candidatus Sumerlaeota bacterium]HOR64668.1 dockerin type I repeat-containing protein [Candidatus Sumerlaeota bacterium]HPL74318.1 dockerin type I repeat-containing protein [Candidatus Sumerlaeota bacterium]HRU54535.1 dockerin type I repeat-containing protein [Candidatus Sumerlaeia bacterium]